MVVHGRTKNWAFTVHARESTYAIGSARTGMLRPGSDPIKKGFSASGEPFISARNRYESLIKRSCDRGPQPLHAQPFRFLLAMLSLHRSAEAR